MRGVDAGLCKVTNRFQQRSFTPNGLEQRNVRGSEGMLSTRLAEPLRDSVVIRLEEHDVTIHSSSLYGCLDIGKPVKRHAQIAGIYDRRDALRCRLRRCEL